MQPSFSLDALRGAVARVLCPSRMCGLPALLAVLVSLAPVPVRAAWNNAAETLDTHPTWIYIPASTMNNGKRGLLIVLHGCSQTHTELKNAGNLESTAENNALVVAVPSVGPRVWAGFQPAKCWDYDGARDRQGHIADIVKIAARLKARGALAIDADHVYVAGLSSGAALALDAACRAPDMFAGVAAVAGPSPGSDQNDARAGRESISSQNVDRAVQACRSLAGDSAPGFDTQIANIAYGSMDFDGPDARYRHDFMSPQDREAHAGQLALISTRWSEDNVIAFQRLYGADAPGAAEPVQGDFGKQRIARKGGKPRVSSVVVNNVGHAWPAGSGRPNVPSQGGLWIAQSGLNYADYAAGWLIANNLRAQPRVGPEVSVQARARNSKVLGFGTVSNRDGSRPEAASALLNGSNQVVDSHGGVEVKADGRFADTYADVRDGRYKLQVSARDSAGNTTTRLSNEVVVGQPPEPPARCFTDNNFGHVAAGRAIFCSNGFACAKGSGDNLGLFNVFITSSVVEKPAGFYRKESCR